MNKEDTQKMIDFIVDIGEESLGIAFGATSEDGKSFLEMEPIFCAKMSSWFRKHFRAKLAKRFSELRSQGR